MNGIGRREFMYLMASLSATPIFANSHMRLSPTGKVDDYYKLKPFGNARILHITDTHAQLMPPVYFREPSVNIGLFGNKNVPPHVVGKHFLDYYGIKDNNRLTYAFTCVNFEKNAEVMGRMGGFAQIKTIADSLRKEFGEDKTLFLDGGDTWQGS